MTIKLVPYSLSHTHVHIHTQLQDEAPMFCRSRSVGRGCEYEGNEVVVCFLESSCCLFKNSLSLILSQYVYILSNTDPFSQDKQVTAEFREQLDDLLGQRLSEILTKVSVLRKFNDDREMFADVLFQISKGWRDSPDIRYHWMEVRGEEWKRKIIMNNKQQQKQQKQKQGG